VPTGTVSVTGYLLPSEPPGEDGRAPGEPSGLPQGQVTQVDVTNLIKVWPQPLLTGYLLLSGQTPASATAPAHLVGLQAGNSALALQNVSYAIQWFLFAGFGMYVWWRLVREDYRGTLGRGRRERGGSAGPDPARSAAGPVGDDGAPTPAVGGTHP
jgi:cytochrome oxidase assembly protein ShyY1